VHVGPSWRSRVSSRSRRSGDLVAANAFDFQHSPSEFGLCAIIQLCGEPKSYAPDGWPCTDGRFPVQFVFDFRNIARMGFRLVMTTEQVGHAHGRDGSAGPEGHRFAGHAKGRRIPLAKIDPFTFFATFNRRLTEENRREIWRTILPADRKIVACAEANGVGVAPEDDQTYRQWLKTMLQKLGSNFPQIPHDAHVFDRKRAVLMLDENKMRMLWERFHSRVLGFVDFANPGEQFPNEETRYKRAILKKFEQDLGREKLSGFVAAGEGSKAAKEVGRVLTSNLVNFRAWRITLGETDEASCAMLRECLEATSKPYSGPESISGIFDVCARYGLIPTWDALSVLLWALRPSDFFPVKISFYRKLARELGHELPEGRPDADKLDSLIQFGQAFREALQPQKPSDWVDVQSFIWCVCPRAGADELGSPFTKIFNSYDEAWLAFDVVRSALLGLGVEEQAYEEDTRIALTLLPANSPKSMRLNFGNWVILSFFAPESRERQWEFMCRKDYVPEAAQDAIQGQFSDRIDGKEFVIVGTSPERLKAGPNRTAFETSLTDASERFAEWQASPYRNAHRPVLLRMAFDEAERDRLLRAGMSIDPQPIPPDPPIQPPVYTKSEAMKELFLPEAQFDEMLSALHEKRNVVLQGAPGVGKTFVARRLAYALLGAKDPARVEIIQFHQSYSYEDFIQGFRPTPKGHFDLRFGIFHQFCRRAQQHEEAGVPHVFIIDEINRGNLSKIFGELLMLIEADKRGREHAIPLAYCQEGDEKFYIPENLYFIGMMNTADRSLAMVDYALRRRFRFITLKPEFSSDAFRASLQSVGAKPELVNRIIKRMNELNGVIAADVRNLGPGYQIGHSYFCPRNGTKPDENWYRRVVEAEIVPLIQEYWFDNEQKVNEHRSALLA
jgi:MoxR-like ATPase